MNDLVNTAEWHASRFPVTPLSVNGAGVVNITVCWKTGAEARQSLAVPLNRIWALRIGYTLLDRMCLFSPGDKPGPYEIVAPLGAGGMGEVYRARDSKLNRNVAV
jgi:serine/threonine protein kinase